MKIYDGQSRSIAVNNTTRMSYFLTGTAGAISFYLLDLVTLARGMAVATLLFIIHKTLQLRVEYIANFVTEKSSVNRSDGNTLGFLGTVIVYFLIFAPLSSHRDYVWPYTIILVTKFTFFALFYISLMYYQREMIQKVQQIRDGWYWYRWIFPIVALGDLIFVYQIRSNPGLRIIEILFTPVPVAIGQAEYPIVFIFSTICALCTLFAILIIGTFVVLWLYFLALIVAIPLIILTSPELLQSGLSTMPTSVRYWGAFAAIMITIISAMPKVLDLLEVIGKRTRTII